MFKLKLPGISSFKPVFRAVEFVFFAVFALVLTIIGVLFATGALNGHKVHNAVSALQGREFAETAAAPQPQKADEFTTALALQNESLARLKSEEEKLAQIEILQNQINTKMTEITLRENKLAKDLAAFQEEKVKFQKFIDETFPRAEGENYSANLKIFAKMSAKEVANMFSTWDTNTVIRYLKGFKESFSAEVLTELRKNYKEKSSEIEVILMASTIKPEIK